MATILLAAAGAAVGAGFGGTVLGLSGAVIGRAVGATLGRSLDQRLLGAGSAAVETGRIDRFRLTGASEGTAVTRIWGRMRVPGQVIWATRFSETAARSGGKGAPRPSTTQFSYTVSLAIALCEGEITRVGRIWADGAEIAPNTLNLRVYPGSQTQLVDPKIEAVEGSGMATAYRGTAYVVFEDLELGSFGNRVPQFSFEVIRAAQGEVIDAVPDLARGLRAVAMIPGTGEYALATTPVHFDYGLGENVSANVHSPTGETDFAVSLETLRGELPNCGSVSLVVSWFGDDLRANACTIRPKVDRVDLDGVQMPWSVSGVTRGSAAEAGQYAGHAVYGGTPADTSVIEAITRMRADGLSVMFYPFVLMDQMAGNVLPDPWTGGSEQPALPWRGRITLSVAPGRDGSPDGSTAAQGEVAAFFGNAAPADFDIASGQVVYGGPEEWSLRRFILHYANLCNLAGGVDAFCIGSELVALTQIRGTEISFPAVAELRALAADVRAVLGADCKIGYAADWSEYFGYHPGDGDVFFHLDPLWADDEIDFIGIDNYMPVSDWRDGESHADAHWGSIYNPDYLQANIDGGEGFDWYYASPEHRDAQLRTPITDGEYGEAWVWRVKDLRGWWENSHRDRVGGVRLADATAWQPQSKPIWFTEIGCAAVDKATNQPNKFLDAKSSESGLPYYSDGRRDELIQMQYLRAQMDFWSDETKNPVSEVFAGRMVDVDRAHVWAWDARPFPQFPGLTSVWSDGENYARGHWISGRVSAQPLASVVAEICAASGLKDVDVSGLYGLVHGYALSGGESARASLQSLMLAYGFEAAERDGTVNFRMRDGVAQYRLGEIDLALSEGPRIECSRSPEAENAGRVRLAYVDANGDYLTRTVEALLADEAGGEIAQTELPLAMMRSEARRVVERWLTESRVARDTAKFALPPSLGHIGAGDVVELATDEISGRYRIDRLEHAGALSVEAVRVEPAVYAASDEAEDDITARAFVAPVPVFPVFLDLPLMTGTEDPLAPHLAVSAKPWPGSVAVFSSIEDDGYELNRTIAAGAVIGTTLTPLYLARSGVWDRGGSLRLRLPTGTLESVSEARLLDGANRLAIGDGTPGNWELMQFANAALVAPGIWEISQRLRGQAGSDGTMPEVWPVGSIVVVLNPAVEQIALAQSARGLVRHYRIGNARVSYDDPSYSHLVEAFDGIGLRPYAPCQLRAVASGPDTSVSWVRRTRIDGDSWASIEVPLGEASESYLIRVLQNATILREDTSQNPQWSYSAVMKAADLAPGAYEIHVGQVSDAFGVGPFARIEING